VTNIEVKTFKGSIDIDKGMGTITAVPKVLSSSYGYLSTSDPTVGASADLTATLQVTMAVPAGGIIYVIFPKWEMNSISSESMLSAGSISCTAGEAIQGSSPSCTVSLG
jgi:hypothetical protein